MFFESGKKIIPYFSFNFFLKLGNHFFIFSLEKIELVLKSPISVFDFRSDDMIGFQNFLYLGNIFSQNFLFLVDNPFSNNPDSLVQLIPFLLNKLFATFEEFIKYIKSFNSFCFLTNSFPSIDFSVYTQYSFRRYKFPQNFDVINAGGFGGEGVDCYTRLNSNFWAHCRRFPPPYEKEMHK